VIEGWGRISQWYIMHSVNAISIPIELGPFDSIGAEEDEKLMKTIYA
jgi:hypothetical protein